MKINPSAGHDYYQSYIQGLKNAENKAGADAKPPAGTVTNTDKVTFSNSAAVRSEVSRLATTVAAQVEETGSSARINELRTAVQNGSYSVPAGEVANAILGLDRKV